MSSGSREQSERSRPPAPLVSILTPSFNQRRWLADTLDSVARQTYPNIEHVVCDGGSTDGSVELLRSSLPADSWVSEPDGGQSHALNKAFARSRGEIIGWLNSDDAYLFDDVVAAVVAHFESHPEAGVVYGHAALVSEEGQLLQVTWAPPFSAWLLKRSNFIIQPTVFMRREVLANGFVDESFDFTMDRELWLRLLPEHTFSRIDRVIAIDRHQPERKTTVRPDLLRKDGIRLAEMYGIPDGRVVELERKLLRIGYRIRGARIAARLRTDHKAFGWSLDSHRRLLVRQLMVKRRFMTPDAAGPA